MDTFEDEALEEAWYNDLRNELRAEQIENHTFTRDGLSSAEFVSYSNGRGRKKRRYPREVMLVTYAGRTYLIGNKLTRDLERLMKDVYPENLNLANGLSWLESFVIELRKYAKLKNI